MKNAARKLLSILLAVSILVTVSGAGALVALADGETAHTLTLGTPTTFVYDGNPKVFDGTITLDSNPVTDLAANHITITYKLSSADDSTYSDTAPSNAGAYTVRAVWNDGVNTAVTATTAMTIEQADATGSATISDRYAIVGYHSRLSQIALTSPWSWVDGNISLSPKPSPESAVYKATDTNHKDVTSSVIIRYVSFPLTSGYSDNGLLEYTKGSTAHDLSGIIGNVNGSGVTYSVAWKSDNTSVASVSGSSLTAVGVGLAKLTASVTVSAVNGETTSIAAQAYSFLVLVTGSTSTVNSAKQLSSIISNGTGAYEMATGEDEHIYAAAYAVEHLPISQRSHISDSAMDKLSYLLYGLTKNDVDTDFDTEYESGISSRRKIYLTNAGWLRLAGGVDGEDDPENIELILTQIDDSDYDVVFDAELYSDATGRMRAIDPYSSVWLEIEMPSDYSYKTGDKLVLYADGYKETLDFDYDKSDNTITFRTDELGEFRFTYASYTGSSASGASSSTSSEISVGKKIPVTTKPGASSSSSSSSASSSSSSDTNYVTGGPVPATPSEAQTETIVSPQRSTVSIDTSEAEKTVPAPAETPVKQASEEKPADIEQKTDTDSSQVTVINPDTIKNAAAENRELILAAVIAAFVSSIVSGSILYTGSLRAKKHVVSLAML